MSSRSIEKSPTALSEVDMPTVLASGTATARTAPSELASQFHLPTQLIHMASMSSQCVHPSVMVISENIIVYSWRPPLDVQHMPSPIAFNPSKTGSIRHSQIGLAIFQGLIIHPVCFLGYEGQKGSGPERPISGGCSSGTGGFGTVHSPELAYSHPAAQGVKRKRRGGRGPPQPPKSTGTKQSMPNFACHFYLHDRMGHSGCLYISLKRISDVRQHLLERAHYQVVHCPVCGMTFTGRPVEARQERDAHIQAETCEPLDAPPNYPGITEDQDRTIRDIAHATRRNQYSQVQRWFDIWDCLFPGEERPLSPFLDDLPEIQRVFDWRSTIFDNNLGLWRELPSEPWTATMSLEEQRAGMSDFIGRFIVLARGLVAQDTSPVENHHEGDISSYMDVNTPAPSSASANIGMPSVASFDPNRPVVESRRAYLSPTSATGPRQTQRLGRARSSLGDWSAPVPIRPQTYPATDVPQGMPRDTSQGAQQPAAAEEDTAVQDHTSDDPLAYLFEFDWDNVQGL